MIWTVEGQAGDADDILRWLRDRPEPTNVDLQDEGEFVPFDVDFPSSSTHWTLLQGNGSFASTVDINNIQHIVNNQRENRSLLIPRGIYKFQIDPRSAMDTNGRDLLIGFGGEANLDSNYTAFGGRESGSWNLSFFETDYPNAIIELNGNIANVNLQVDSYLCFWCQQQAGIGSASIIAEQFMPYPASQKRTSYRVVNTVAGIGFEAINAESRPFRI